MKRIALILGLLLIVGAGSSNAQSIGELPVFSTTDQYKLGYVSCPDNTVLALQIINPRRALVSCPPYFLAAPTVTPTQSALPTVTPTPVVPVEFVWSSQPDNVTGIDTDVVENAPNGVHPNSVQIGVNSRPGLRSNSLFYFDVSSIPANSVVVSATLTLHNAVTSTQVISFAAHSLLPAPVYWNEMSTWNYLQPSTVRHLGDVAGNGGIDAGASVAGVDYNNTPLGYATYAPGTPRHTAFRLGLVPEMVQSWVESDNYGLLLRASGGGLLAFHSSEAVAPAMRPRLDISYMVLD